jgi:cobalt/nickel transport protein
MNKRDKSFVVGGLIVAIIIAILAPFLASSNPDGLESAAEKIAENPEPEPLFEAPLPDYSIPALGESPLGGVVSIVLGTLVAFLAMVGLATVARWFKPENGSSN